MRFRGKTLSSIASEFKSICQLVSPGSRPGPSQPTSLQAQAQLKARHHNFASNDSAKNYPLYDVKLQWAISPINNSLSSISIRGRSGGRHSTEVAFMLLAPPARVRFSASVFPRKILHVAARLIDSKRICIKSLIVDRSHTALVWAVLQKNNWSTRMRCSKHQWQSVSPT